MTGRKARNALAAVSFGILLFPFSPLAHGGLGERGYAPSREDLENGKKRVEEMRKDRSVIVLCRGKKTISCEAVLTAEIPAIIERYREEYQGELACWKAAKRKSGEDVEKPRETRVKVVAEGLTRAQAEALVEEKAGKVRALPDAPDAADPGGQEADDASFSVKSLKRK